MLILKPFSFIWSSSFGIKSISQWMWMYTAYIVYGVCHLLFRRCDGSSFQVGRSVRFCICVTITFPCLCLCLCFYCWCCCCCCLIGHCCICCGWYGDDRNGTYAILKAVCVLLFLSWWNIASSWVEAIPFFYFGIACLFLLTIIYLPLLLFFPFTIHSYHDIIGGRYILTEMRML